MPYYRQGDIFLSLADKPQGLMVVFGHTGFNFMGPKWWEFSKTVPEWAEITNPFEELQDGPHEFKPNKWAWFFSEERNHGMRSRVLARVLDEAVHWAHENKIITIATNGIANTDHGLVTVRNLASDDRRALEISRMAQQYEEGLGVEITLISLNNVFVRLARRLARADAAARQQKD